MGEDHGSVDVTSGDFATEPFDNFTNGKKREILAARPQRIGELVISDR